jgi:hypothetical protein
MARNVPHFAQTGSIDVVAVGRAVGATLAGTLDSVPETVTRSTLDCVGWDTKLVDVRPDRDSEGDSVTTSFTLSLVIGFDGLDEIQHVSQVYTISPSDD